MKYTAAIAALKGLEGGADLASVIEGHVTELDQKAYKAIAESSAKSTKVDAYEGVLTAIAKSVGVEGDLESALPNLESKLKAVVDDGKSASTKLTEAETRATAAETQVKTFERQGKLSQIATKAGASVKALEKLLGDRLDDLTIDGETVKLGDKTLREFVEGDDALKDFVPALFPTTTTDSKNGGKRLPAGTPDGKGETPKSPVDATVSRMKFAVPGAKQA